MRNYKGITSDSREVKEGFIFIALNGLTLKGEDFIEDAIKRGAKKIVIEQNSKAVVSEGIEVEKVKNIRRYMALACRDFYQVQPENIVAVTGTSGKTSTAFYFKQICEFLNLKSASIGTLGALSKYAEFDNSDVLTSPFPGPLHRDLKKLSEAGVTHLILEASSHGLDQYRLDGINFKAAAFTNLSQDHLDYHKNFEEYLNAKIRLFTELTEKGGYAIINADVKEAKTIIAAIKKQNPTLRICTYGKEGRFIKLITRTSDSATILFNNKTYKITFNLAGNFQIYNLMAAMGLAIAVGLKIEEIIEIIPQIKAAPGRMEHVADYNGAQIFVDYSHKPDALEKALQSLRPQCKGKLHLIFGCGGDRDPFKRPIMGKIAAVNADVIYVTDDNPRSEDAYKIRKEIISACVQAIEVDDRGKCIELAIKNLAPNDMMLIAGKGHEDYQIIGTKKIHFSDKEEVLKVLELLKLKH